MEYLSIGLSAICVILLIVLLVRKTDGQNVQDDLNELKRDLDRLDGKVQNNHSSSLDQITRLQNSLVQTLDVIGDALKDAQTTGQKDTNEHLDGLDKEMRQMRKDTQESLDNINRIVTEKMQTTMQTSFTNMVSNLDTLGKSLNESQEKQQKATVNELNQMRTDFEKIRTQMQTTLDAMRAQNQKSLDSINEVVSDKMQKTLDTRINEAFTTVVNNMDTLGKSLNETQEKQKAATVTELTGMRTELTKSLEDLRKANTESLDKMRKENQENLDKINGTVNEKLQKTLDDKITQSFETVNQRLKEVYEGLGEMKNVAAGVSDLKNVLSNVKTRGTLGEIQLGSILSEILPSELYQEQVQVVPRSTERVDFAVKLPGSQEGEHVYLPIDSKFPGDSYAALLQAYESGNPALVKEKRTTLENEIKRAAKSIADKYVNPPQTTNFAIMFLPFEGLYAEVVNMGLVETLQNQYKINIAGPSTMAAMLNSLQMGFKTLAIQKKSGEVWKILETAKKEFGNFEKVLDSVRNRLNQADNELEKLIGVRTRKINASLRSVTTIENKTDDPAILTGIAELE